MNSMWRSALVSATIGALPGLRVLSRNKPSTPLSAKHCCHPHTVSELTPMLRHLLRRVPICRGQHDPAAPHVCAAGCSRPRSPPIARAPLRPKPRILLCHGPIPQAMASIVYPAAAVGIRPVGRPRGCKRRQPAVPRSGDALRGRRQRADGSGASASQMGRFETEWLARPENLAALADLPGQWIEAVHQRCWPRVIELDMDSSESPTYGEQEGSAYNGHIGCTCYHPLFVFNQLGDLERCALRAGNVHSAEGWRAVLKPVVARYRGRMKRLYFRGDAAFANPEIYEFLEAEGMGYAIRLPTNRVLQDKIGHLLKRPAGRPPQEMRRYYSSFSYRAGSWTKPPAGGGQGRVAPRRALSAGRLHRHQPGAPGRAGRGPSTTTAAPQSSDQGGQGRNQVDPPIMPLLRRECRPPPGCMLLPTTWATSCGRWRCRVQIDTTLNRQNCIQNHAVKGGRS